MSRDTSINIGISNQIISSVRITFLSRIMACSNTRDVSEDTLGIYAMAADYARLDAPIVKEYDLLELLTEVEKGQISALNKLEYYYS